MKRSSLSIFTALIFAILLIGSAVVFAQAPNHDDFNINYPIAELGNCQNKQECRAYCNTPSNLTKCIEFAEANGLMNGKEAETARKFNRLLNAGNTPGGCNSPQGCESFCTDIAHIDECIAFADQTGHDVPELGEARRIAAHLKSGGTMPGKCQSKAQCEIYCSNFDHIDECLAFADKIGLNIDDELDRNQIKQIVDLMKRGETPGKCQSKGECQAYCESGEHIEECVAFGAKMGFIGEKEARLMRETGGRGPGNCRGEKECRTFCDDPAHSEECFAFAKKHDLLSGEDMRRMEQGLNEMKKALDQAPPEIVECLKSNLGPNIIENIRNGSIAPSRQIGERMQTCFEDFFANNPNAFGREPRHEGDGDFESFMRNAPPGVINCLKERAVADLELELRGERTNEDFRDKVNQCLREFGPKDEHGEEFGDIPPAGNIESFIGNLPPHVKECVRPKIQAITDPRVIESVIRECMASTFRDNSIPSSNSGMTDSVQVEPNYNKHDGSFQNIQSPSLQDVSDQKRQRIEEEIRKRQEEAMRLQLESSFDRSGGGFAPTNGFINPEFHNIQGSLRLLMLASPLGLLYLLFGM